MKRFEVGSDDGDRDRTKMGLDIGAQSTFTCGRLEGGTLVRAWLELTSTEAAFFEVVPCLVEAALFGRARLNTNSLEAASCKATSFERGASFRAPPGCMSIL